MNLYILAVDHILAVVIVTWVRPIELALSPSFFSVIVSLCQGLKQVNCWMQHNFHQLIKKKR